MNIYDHCGLFLDNQSTKDYYQLIVNAMETYRKKTRVGSPGYIYYESHHILPKSLFPQFKDCSWNQVLLTGKEHYQCHEMLIKMTTGPAYHQMVCALWNMAVRTNNNMDRAVFGAEEYQILREKFVASKSKLGKRPCKESTKVKIGLSNKGRIPSPTTIANSVAARLGKSKSPAAIKKSADAQRGNKNVAGKLWWHNGIQSTMSFTSPGEGWIKGRLFKNHKG